ncbi:vasotab-like [Stomoxys calcitrans]|uniref:Kazal-like domain-containing protein n=1 Tax=Stomoxys calcitrans TaxID=35570 RepID=A0A1I8P2G1_STOCA|nr:vasotab-like [Stomoxys calcitrans]
MNSISLVLALALAILCSLMQVEGNATCRRICTFEYEPVCGTLKGPGPRIDSCTFGNLCAFKVHKCITQHPWTHSDGRCRRDNPNCDEIIRS